MHKVNDKRGTNSYANRYHAGGLYPSPLRTYTSLRPRYYYAVTDTPKAFNAGDRTIMLRYARELFTTVSTLNGAVRQKAQYSVLDAFSPRYRGANTAWGEQVEDWLTHKVYPVANVRGGNYTFNNTLFALSIALDVDGEALVYLSQSRDGFPQFGIIPSHRIGQRNSTETQVKSGRYKGNTIIDGVILNNNNRPIAYRILGDKVEDDYDLSAQSALLLFESDWTDGARGVSRFGPALLDALNTQDIDYYLQLGVRLDSSMGLLSWTQGGEADPQMVANPLVAEDETVIQAPLVTNNQSGVSIEPLLGGMIQYLRAGTGEKIEAFRTDRPHGNVEAFIKRLERRILYSLSWPYEMLNATEIGGASTRLVQSEARNSIRARQHTLGRAAKFIVAYSVALGMQNGLVDPNYDSDWFNWSFSHGKLLTVDEGREAESDRKDLLLGTTTLQQIAAKSGSDWWELRQQTRKEVEDLLDNAKGIADKHGITLDKALSLLQQRSPNESPIASPDSTDSPVQGNK